MLVCEPELSPPLLFAGALTSSVFVALKYLVGSCLTVTNSVDT